MYSNLVSLQPQRIESQKEGQVGFVTPYIWLFVVRFVIAVKRKQRMKLSLAIRKCESFTIRNVEKESPLK